MGSDDKGYPLNVPKNFREMGHFWYQSQLLSFILRRPNSFFAKVLSEAKVSAGWDKIQRPLLSMHVRHGVIFKKQFGIMFFILNQALIENFIQDSCSAEQQDSKKRRCDPLETYMKTVLPMAKRCL